MFDRLANGFKILKNEKYGLILYNPNRLHRSIVNILIESQLNDNEFKCKFNIDLKTKSQICYLNRDDQLLILDFRNQKMIMKVKNREIIRIDLPHMIIDFYTLIRLFDVNEGHVYKLLNVNVLGYVKLTNAMVELNALVFNDDLSCMQELIFGEYMIKVNNAPSSEEYINASKEYTNASEEPSKIKSIVL